LILSPPSRGRGPRGTNEATPELLLNVLLDTLEYLPKFEITVLEYLQRWRSPGHLQRNWFWYTLGSTVASYSCIKFLNNRQQIMANMQEARGIMSNFTYEHVLEPVMKIYHHVFKTLKNRQIETTSQQLGASRLHLSNMLRAYGMEHQDFTAKEVESMAARGDMSIVMKRYEEEVQKPLRSIGSGGIVQALLIQIQKLKVDTETTMLAVDQLIEANEINFELAATIPALLVVFPVLNALYQFWRSKKIPMFEQKAFYQLRLLLRKIDKVLTNYSNNQTGGSLSATGAGYILLHSARIDSLSRGIINGPELRHLREDLADLNSPAYTVAQKRFVIDRMTRTLPLMATASKSLSL
jgi:nuclear-control-of-ATPase protein 2